MSSQHPDPRRVLIVDDSAESREVLKTLLERRGLEILEAGEAEEGLHLLRQYRPEVTILDAEEAAENQPELPAAFGSESQKKTTSLVVLGAARRVGVSLPPRQVVRKPYHYGPLIRTIEQLLDDVQAAE